MGDDRAAAAQLGERAQTTLRGVETVALTVALTV